MVYETSYIVEHSHLHTKLKVFKWLTFSLLNKEISVQVLNQSNWMKYGQHLVLITDATFLLKPRHTAAMVQPTCLHLQPSA